MIDRAVFFDGARQSLFSGSLDQKQVDGMNALLDAWEATHDQNMARLAYVFATAYHEAKSPPAWKPEMQPVEEYGHGAGHPYGEPDPETGQTYYGRGLVQLTWKDNYRKAGDLVGADLVHQPDLALNPAISTRVLVEGMISGMFTGKKLADYFTEGGSPDFVNARRIINGLDKAEEIAGHARKFYAALVAAT